MNGSMNVGGASAPSRAYLAAQSSVQPTHEPLHVDGSIESLRLCIDDHMELVRMLIRRLEPVSGNLSIDGAGIVSGVDKAPLAVTLDKERDRIAILTMEVRAAIQALQI